MRNQILLRVIRLTVGSLLISAATLLLFACSSPTSTRIFWPRLPDKPMIEFVGLLETSEDFEYSDSEKIFYSIFNDKKNFFKLPYGVVTNSENDIFVSDVEGLKLVSQSNKTVSSIVAKNILKQPMCLAIDSKGMIYLADGKTKTVYQLNGQGKILKQFGADDLFGRPSFIAVNERLERIYVSDKEKNSIVVFDMSGKLIFRIGKPGNESGEFAFPQGVAIAPNNDLYVADALNSRIQVFTADGAFVRSFGYQGRDYWEFDAPRDLAFGPDGNLYVVDFRKALLYVYAPEGQLLLVLGDHKKRTNHPLGFSSPSSIHIDKSGKVYIADMLNHRISVWQILTDEYLSTHPIPKNGPAKM